MALTEKAAKIVHLRFSGSVLAVGLLYKLPQRKSKYRGLASSISSQQGK